MSFKNREEGKARRIQAYEYLVGRGLKPHLAAGVVGNLMQESFGHLDSTAVGDDGQSLGIAQWNGRRLENLKKYAKTNKSSHKNLHTQLGFLFEEINSTYAEGSDSWNKRQQANFFKSTNAEDAAEAFMINFERPSKGKVLNRKKYATKIFLEANDNNVYSRDAKGNIVSVDPTTASQATLNNSPTLQRKLYSQEFDRLSKEFENLSAQNRAAESKLKKYNESEELKRAKDELRAKYSEERFIEALTHGNNNNPNGETATEPEVGEEMEDNSTNQSEQTSEQINTAKDELLSMAFKTPTKTPVVPTQPEQNPSMYPELERSENEYYQAYLPEGFEDGGEADPPPNYVENTVNKPVKERDYSIDFGDYTNNVERGPEPTPERAKRAPLKIQNFNKFKDSELGAALKAKETTELSQIKKASDVIKIEDAIVQTNLNKADSIRLQSEAKKKYEARSNKLDKEAISTQLDMELYKTPQQVRALQQLLKNKGFNLDPDNKFKNEGVDGQLGEVTKQALADYNNMGPEGEYTGYKKGKDQLGDCKEKQCSEYVQNEIFRNFKPDMSRSDWNKSVGIHGDAWHIGKNIINAGGAKVNLNSIKKGDVVGIDPNGSDYKARALAETKGKIGYTHTGVVDEVNPDGSYYVLHNWHEVKDGKAYGKEYRTLIDPNKGHHFTGGFHSKAWVVEAFRPNYSNAKYQEKIPLRDDVHIKVSEDKLEALQAIDKSYLNLDMKEVSSKFVKTINSPEVKEKLARKYNLTETEYQSIAKASLGILAQESSLGTSYGAVFKPGVASAAKFLGLKDDEVSRGAGRIKWNANYGDRNISEFGVDEHNFTEAANQPIVVMDILAKNYTSKREPNVKKERLLYYAIQKYNRGSNSSDAWKLEEHYVNKVINFANLFTVEDKKGTEYNTLTDKLGLEPSVIDKGKQLLGYKRPKVPVRK